MTDREGDATVTDPTVDVLIAGGGPVGLFLASELGLAGVRTLVVERRAEPTPGTVPALRGVSRRTMNVLGLRGLRAPLVEGAAAALRTIAARAPITYATEEDYAGERYVRENFADWRLEPAMKGHFGVIPVIDRLGEFPDQAIAPVPYDVLERVFAERALANGCALVRGRAVSALTPHAAGVAVTLDDGSVVGARYVVGADGGRSTVRRLAGFDFPGTEPSMVARGAELARLADAHRIPFGVTRLPKGVLLVGLVPGQIQVLEYDMANAAAPTTAAELQASLRRVSGTEVTVEEISMPIRYTDAARQPATYRLGRVLLAGDAAHVHSPFGAQGLNLGLQDAANLGWKLAHVTKGHAAPDLLDTYTGERHPVAARVLRNTRAQAALVHPNAQVDALRSVFAEVMEFAEVRRYFIELIAGTDIRYDLPGEHPLTGGFVPDLPLRDAPAATAAELLADGRALLLDLTDSPGGGVEGWHDRVRVVRARCPSSPELAALLVRPDGHVAWAADQVPGRDADPVAVPDAVLTAWFGTGAARPVSVTPS